MSPSRVTDWQIKPGEKDDSYDLYLRGKRVLEDSSMTAINKYLKKHREQHQTVHEIADDGYVTDRTRALNRKQKGLVPQAPGKRRAPVRMPLIRF